jgi:hypothetical protein
MRSASRLAVWVMLALCWDAAAAADHPKNEIWLGVGGASSSEKSVFNVPNDIASVPEGAVSLGFLHNLNARHAIGFHLYGAFETTPEIPLQGASGSQPVRFDLSSSNFGVRYRYAFARRTLVPYLFAGANASGALIESSATPDVFAYGVSGCVGPGLGVRLGRHFMLSAEGIASFGKARWEKLPAANSSSTDFDPSLLAGTINLSVVWGAGGSAPPGSGGSAVADSSAATAASGAAATVFGAGELTAGKILLTEGLILLLSAPAYAGDEGASLAGVTAASALLGTAAGAESAPLTWKTMFFGLLSLAALEFTLGRAGATDDALFATSVVGWNAVSYLAYRAELKARTRR